MDLLQLHYFITIAECQHMTQAAARLHVSQPSLSKSLARFEAELGLQLFDREGRRISLNPYGRIVLARARAVFRELDNMHTELDLARAQESATLHLGSVDAIYVKDWLPEFIDAHPHIMVQHRVASCAALEKQLTDGSLDLAISDAQTLSPGIHAHRLSQDEYLVLAPRCCPVSDSQPQDFSVFRDQPFICAPRTAGIKRPIDILSEACGFTPAIVFEGGPALLSRLLDMDYGCLIISRAQIADDSLFDTARERYKVIHLTNPESHFSVRILWDQARTLSASAQCLLDHLLALTSS